MNYLNRPVFLFPVDWDAATQRSLNFDLRETSLGFGAEYFTPTAAYTVTGWDFSIVLESGNDWITFEAFADSRFGQLQGFWLPCPLQAAAFAAAISPTQFKIVAEDLAATWNERPDQHLFFEFTDGTQFAAKISDVTDSGDGTETVTLAAALPQPLTADCRIQRLHYVRFNDDTEAASFLSEHSGTLKLSVVELPLEYTNAATGLQPVFLYHFWADTPVNNHWRYTSFAAPVVSNGKVFSNWPMSHGEIKQTTDGNSNPVDITAKPDVSHPFSLFANLPPGKGLRCEILLAYLATPDNTKKIFTGFVDTLEDRGTEYVAHCLDRLAWLKTSLPRFLIGSTCNYILYEPNTCKVLRQFFETTVTLEEIVDGQLPVIRCSFIYSLNLNQYQTDDWFRGGIVETGFGLQYEIRSVLGSKWNGTELELTLNAPLIFAPPDANLQLVTGCDHTVTACLTKFNNFDNFGAFVAVPDQNLSLKGLNASVAQGNKK